MIKISSIKFNNELRTSQDLSYLLGCIGEKIKVDISFYYEDVTYSTMDDQIVETPDYTQSNLFDNTGVILHTGGTAFKNTYVGDKIGIFDNGIYKYANVIEKFDDGMIRTDEVWGIGSIQQGSYFFNCTPFTGVRYAYNLADAGGSYNSLIDGEYQQAVYNNANASVTTPANMTFTGIKSYQIGSVTIKGDGFVGGGATLGTSVQQKFTLTHNTVITPFFKPDDYADLLISVAPAYYKNSECLKYISKVSFGRYLSDPNGLQELETLTNKSNIGWFNETFNGGKTNYVVSSLIMKKGVTVITQLEYGIDITVEATITNTVDTPFSNTNTKFIFGFNYLPNSNSLIQNNGYDQTRNFLFDSKLNTVGTGSVNGDNFGTDLQVIKSLTSTYISTSSIKVTATINISNDAKDILDQDSTNRYTMWLITENHANTAVNSDKVNLLLSVNNINATTVNGNIIDIVRSNFIIHPFNDASGAVESNELHIFPVDDIVANTDFVIDFKPSVTGVSGVNTQWVQPIAASSFFAASTDCEIYVDSKTIATATWQGTPLATAQQLRDSLNNGTQPVPPFLASGESGVYAFDGATGYTAYIGVPVGALSVLGNCLIIVAPAYGASYDAKLIRMAYVNGGGSGAGPNILYKNGVDEVIGSITNQGSIIKKIRSKLLIRDVSAGQVDIVLEDFAVNTLSYPVVGGKAQAISFSQDRVFNIEAGIRKSITANRDYASDNGNLLYYNYKYPFMDRWEYWLALQNISATPADLFDNTKPFNGMNNFWYRMANIASLVYQLSFVIEQNGVDVGQTFESVLSENLDFMGNTAEWGINTIKSYDGITEIVNLGVKYVYGYKDVKIEAKFQKLTGTIPEVNQMGIVIWIETFEGSGINEVRRISSFYDVNASSWFKSIDTSNRVKITKVGDVYTGECLLDYTKIPVNTKFTVYARVYEFYSSNKLFQDGVDFLFQDGEYYEFN